MIKLYLSHSKNQFLIETFQIIKSSQILLVPLFYKWQLARDESSQSLHTSSMKDIDG